MSRHKTCECIYWARTDILQSGLFPEHHPHCPNAWTRVFKVSTAGQNPFYAKDIKNVSSWLTDAEPGDIIQIEILKMHHNEYVNLTEYEG